MNKRIMLVLIIAMVFMLSFVFVACGESSAENSSDGSGSSASDSSVRDEVTEDGIPTEKAVIMGFEDAMNVSSYSMSGRGNLSYSTVTEYGTSNGNSSGTQGTTKVDDTTVLVDESELYYYVSYNDDYHQLSYNSASDNEFYYSYEESNITMSRETEVENLLNSYGLSGRVYLNLKGIVAELYNNMETYGFVFDDETGVLSLSEAKSLTIGTSSFEIDSFYVTIVSGNVQLGIEVDAIISGSNGDSTSSYSGYITLSNIGETTIEIDDSIYTLIDAQDIKTALSAMIDVVIDGTGENGMNEYISFMSTGSIYEYNNNTQTVGKDETFVGYVAENVSYGDGSYGDIIQINTEMATNDKQTIKIEQDGYTDYLMTIQDNDGDEVTYHSDDTPNRYEGSYNVLQDPDAMYTKAFQNLGAARATNINIETILSYVESYFDYFISAKTMTYENGKIEIKDPFVGMAYASSGSAYLDMIDAFTFEQTADGYSISASSTSSTGYTTTCNLNITRIGDDMFA